jgi:hypothetical protein
MPLPLKRCALNRRLLQAILTMAAVATCLRAFALHQYTQRLSELSVRAGWRPGTSASKHAARAQGCYLAKNSTLCFLPEGSAQALSAPRAPGSQASQQAGPGGADGEAGAAGGAASALSSAQRRARRPSLLTAVAAAGRPFNLLHLRLSLVDRDFTEPGDYELLLRLDELEAGEPCRQRGMWRLPAAEGAGGCNVGRG